MPEVKVNWWTQFTACREVILLWEGGCGSMLLGGFKQGGGNMNVNLDEGPFEWDTHPGTGAHSASMRGRPKVWSRMVVLGGGA